ncbi:MAG: hypothetical protein HFG40_04145 [Bacilli bacterium]|nr:hypothetical protein [Bacilli bacterium]
MDNKEMDQSYALDKEGVEVVSETRASSKLKRNLKNKKIMRVAVYVSLFIAATTLAETSSISADAKEATLVSENTNFMTFEEAHNKTMAPIIRQVEQALDERDQVEQNDFSESIKAPIKQGTTEAEMVKETDPKVEQVLKNTVESNHIEENEVEQEQNSYRGTLEMYENSEYWELTGRTARGGTPPQDVGTRIWLPSGQEWVPVQSEEDVMLAIPVWTEVAFNYNKLIDKVGYEQLADTLSITEDGERSITFPAIYGSADRAVLKEEPIPSKYTANFAGSKVGMPYVLENGVPVRVEDFNSLNDLDAFSMSFPLIREDKNGKSQIIGYVNAVDVIDNVSFYMLESYSKQFSL